EGGSPPARDHPLGTGGRPRSNVLRGLEEARQGARIRAPRRRGALRVARRRGGGGAQRRQAGNARNAGVRPTPCQATRPGVKSVACCGAASGLAWLVPNRFFSPSFPSPCEPRSSRMFVAVPGRAG